jgi:fluoride exporter
MLNYIVIGVGSTMGGASRYWASGLIANRFGQSFPFGTLFVNVTGSFIIGFSATVTSSDGRWFVGPRLRNGLMTGFCGGYTTFSSFSLQTMSLAQNNEWLYAIGNIFLNFVFCLPGVWLGHILAEFINAMKG